MIDALVESFKIYYGLDWLSLVFGILGMWLLSRKERSGFIFQGISIFCAGVISYVAGQYGFVVSAFITMGIMIYGYANWKEDERPEDLT
jgi:nicotinamide riboside transporter PnuC